MCLICALSAALSIFLVPAGRGAHSSRQAAEFQTLMEPYLPAGDRRDQACRALRERLDVAPTGGQSIRRRLFGRPNQAKLMQRAERDGATFVAQVRAGRVDVDSGALATLINFYAALTKYPGEGGRTLKRTGVIAGTVTVPLALIAGAFYVQEYPELCGAAPAMLGGHAAHAMVGLGVAGLVNLARVLLSPTGKAWWIDVGTAEHDQASGARRAEDEFWRVVMDRWNQSSFVPTIDVTPGAVGARVLDLVDGEAGLIRRECQRSLSPSPACHACDTGEPSARAI